MEEEQPDQQEEQQEVQPPPKKQRKKVQQHRLKPDMITDPSKGLIYLYNTMKDRPLHKDEGEELSNFMHVLEEWHYQVMPKYDFGYYIDRLQKFGNSGTVKSQLQLMRKAHKGLIDWNFITQQQQVNTNNPNNPIDQIQQENELPYQPMDNPIDQIDDTPYVPATPLVINTPQVTTSLRKPLKITLKQSTLKQNLEQQFNEVNDDDIFALLEEARAAKQEAKKNQ